MQYYLLKNTHNGKFYLHFNNKLNSHELTLEDSFFFYTGSHFQPAKVDIQDIKEFLQINDYVVKLYNNHISTIYTKENFIEKLNQQERENFTKIMINEIKKYEKRR